MISEASYRKQKIIYIISIITAIVATVTILGVGFSSYQQEHTPIKVEQGQVLTSEGKQVTKFDYGTTVIATAASIVSERNNKYTLPELAKIKLEETQNDYFLIVENGVVFLEIQDSINLNLNNKHLKIANATVIYASDTKQLYVVEGNIVAGNVTAQASQIIEYLNNEFVVTTADRTIFIQNNWNEIITTLKNISTLPESLQDFEAPTITFAPALPATIETDSLTISGTMSESGKVMLAETELAQIDETGKFTFAIKLEPGSNSIELILVDEWGNKSVQTIKIDRLVTTAVQPVIDSSVIDCATGSVEQQVYCSINKYLVDKNLTGYSNIAELNLAAETLAFNDVKAENNSVDDIMDKYLQPKLIKLTSTTNINSSTAMETLLTKHNSDIASGTYTKNGIGVFQNVAYLILAN